MSIQCQGGLSKNLYCSTKYCITFFYLLNDFFLLKTTFLAILDSLGVYLQEIKRERRQCPTSNY